MGPRLGVSVAVWREGKVLLVQRGKAPFEGAWSLPGGSVEAGETVAEAGLRELMEETGVSARLAGLATYVDAITRTGDGAVARHFVIMVFAGFHHAGTARAAADAADVRWVDPADIAELDTTPNLDRAVAAARALIGRG
ncbi:MAG: NUDIX hydrolase [Rhodobiaceae bacterium]|nr:NUDIX hydrolase [Rhodobiaceae bacterium]